MTALSFPSPGRAYSLSENEADGATKTPFPIRIDCGNAQLVLILVLSPILEYPFKTVCDPIKQRSPRVLCYVMRLRSQFLGR